MLTRAVSFGHREEPKATWRSSIFPLDCFAMLAMTFFAATPFFADAQSFTYDLGIRNQDITFSKGALVAGEKVRIYARVTNWGSADISGYVTFYKGDQLVGDSQVVTVRPNASYDDVWVDFTVPAGSFNIRAEIKGTSPQDQNPSNDVAISQFFTPLPDSDGDLVPDTQDNCTTIANADQRDTDGDGLGDVCDAYPNDPTNTPPAPPAPAPAPAPASPAPSPKPPAPAPEKPAADSPTPETGSRKQETGTIHDSRRTTLPPTLSRRSMPRNSRMCASRSRGCRSVGSPGTSSPSARRRMRPT